MAINKEETAPLEHTHAHTKDQRQANRSAHSMSGGGPWFREHESRGRRI